MTSQMASQGNNENRIKRSFQAGWIYGVIFGALMFLVFMLLAIAVLDSPGFICFLNKFLQNCRVNT